MQRSFFEAWLTEQGEKVWYSNVNWEQQADQAIRLPQIRSQASQQIASQMDVHQIYLADEQDTVILQHKPDNQFLDYIKSEGWVLPQLRFGSRDEHASLFYQQQAVPYLVDEGEERFLQQQQCKVIGPSAALALRLNHKILAREYCESLGIAVTEGEICRSLEQLEAAYQRLKQQSPSSRFVVKSGYGSSGKSLFHLYSERDFDALRTYLQRKNWVENIELTIERWHDIQLNLSAQLFIWDGRAHVIALTQQEINDVGVYRGTLLTPQWQQDLLETYHQQLEKVGNALITLGYQGVIGVDSILDQQGNLIPVIEFNARLTMVTYMLRLRQRLWQSGYRHLTVQYYDLTLKSVLEFSELHTLLHRNIPLSAADNRGYLIYGFHTYHTDSTHYYRVFIAFWAESQEEMYTLKKEVEQNLVTIREMKG